MKILLQATTRAGGDLNPLLALAGGLREAGCELVVLADAAAAGFFADIGLEVQLSSPAWEVGPLVKAALQQSDGLMPDRQLAAVRLAVARWGQALTPEARRLLSSVRPDLLLTSLFGTCIGALLHDLAALPWCALNSTFYIGPDPPRPLERDFSARAAEVFRYSVVPYLAAASLVLHASDALFDYDHRGMPAHNYYTGPLIWEAPAAIPDYVNAPGAPWILVTLSSLRQDDMPIARAALDAQAHTARRVLATIGYGHTLAELGSIPSNAHVAQYVPHSVVLPQSALLVAHAGHGSVMKALWYGVPMVLVPWGRDQFGVAARAEHLGAAVVLPKERLSVHSMAEAIEQALSEPRYQQAARAAARRLRAAEPLATAVELLTGLALRDAE